MSVEELKHLVSSEVKSIPVGHIDASGRLRPVDRAHVELIAASIEQRGLLQPIVVREQQPHPILPDQTPPYTLVLGAHRLEALKALGWKELTVGGHVLIMGVDDFDARIMEIDENIARHELNPLDRALFLAERKRLYEERNEAMRHGGDRRSKKIKELTKSQSLRLDFSERFTIEAAKRTGYSERTIQIAIRLAENLDKAAIEELRGTMVETNQNELMQLCALTKEQQRKAAVAIKSGTAKTVSEARVAIGLDDKKNDNPQARFYASAIDVWGKLDKLHRANLLDAIGVPKDVAKKIVGNEIRHGEAA